MQTCHLFQSALCHVYLFIFAIATSLNAVCLLHFVHLLSICSVYIFLSLHSLSFFFLIYCADFFNESSKTVFLLYFCMSCTFREVCNRMNQILDDDFFYFYFFYFYCNQSLGSGSFRPWQQLTMRSRLVGMCVLRSV